MEAKSVEQIKGTIFVSIMQELNEKTPEVECKIEEYTANGYKLRVSIMVKSMVVPIVKTKKGLFKKAQTKIILAYKPLQQD